MAFEAEVARGIALLDERLPGWRDRIDVDRIDMVWASARATRNNRCCIGAQLADPTDAEDYYDWASWLSGYDSIDQRDEFEEWAYRHGFEAPLGRYPALTDAWKRALTLEAAS